MWVRLQKNITPEVPLDESITSTARSEILTVLFVYIAWHLYRYILGTQFENMRILPLTLMVIAISLAAYFLVSRFYLIANILWLAGLTLVITLFLGIFRAPEISLFLAFLPLLTVTVLGWPFAVVMLVLFAGLLGWLQPAIGLSLPPTYLWIIFLGGAINSLLGWAAVSNSMQITSWSIYNYQKARRDLEEARDERMEFKQLQEDLLHANRELARLSERLKAVNQVAEEAVRVKEEFVANVSHELRTPLNMIIGFCEMITQSPGVYGKKLPPLLLADITAIQRNSQHLAQLVNDVLDLSQIDAGRMALSKQWVLLQDIVNEATEAIQDFFDSKNLYLRVQVPEAPIRLFCDRTRIREVILNLLSNAGRFTDQGGVEICAWVDEPQQQAVFCLADTGPGIAPEDQKRLFEPFQQLDGSIRRKFGGSGLGLYISKQFVEMHGGHMWLESFIGEGTRFYFSLPLVKPVTVDEPSSQSALRWMNPYQTYEARFRKFKAPISQLTPRFVLLETGDTLDRFFKRYMDNVETEPVKTLEEAVEVIKRAPAQAVILNLPPHTFNQKEISAFVANLPYGTPVMSCWIQGNDEAARSLGVVQYLVKPIDRNTLLEALTGLEKPARTVLLVDDHPEVLQLFSRILDSAPDQYQVTRARDGRQALKLLRERRPDVMVLDLILDEMDGFEVLKEKSADPAIRDIPVIVASSLDPTGSPIVSDALSITHKGGLSVRELLSTIQTVSLILAPQSRTADPASQSAAPG